MGTTNSTLSLSTSVVAATSSVAALAASAHWYRTRTHGHNTATTITANTKENGAALLLEPLPQTLGVRLSVLKQLAMEHPGLSIAGVFEKVVRPATCSSDTHAHSRSFVEHLQATAAGAGVGPATCFVSAAWMSSFEDVVDCAEQFEQGQSNHTQQPTFFWLDVLCNNQHNSTAFPAGCWAAAFKDAVKAMGNVLVVLTPWQDPLPLRRAWCLMELVTVVEAGVPMHVAIPSSQHAAFLKAMREDSYGTIAGIAESVDVQQAEAFNPADKELILKTLRALHAGVGKGETEKGATNEHEIEDSVNVNKEKIVEPNQSAKMVSEGANESEGKDTTSNASTLTATIHTHLKQWYMGLCMSLAEKAKDGGLLHALASHAAKNNDLDAAAALYEQALALKGSVLGEAHLDTAATHTALGYLCLQQGEVKRGLEHHEHALRICQHTAGELQRQRAATYLGLGAAHEAKGEHDLARDFYLKDLELSLETSGEKSEATARAYMNVGRVLESKGDDTGALEYYLKAVVIVLDKKDMATADLCVRIASIYQYRGEYNSSLPHLQEALTIYTSLLGPDHITVAGVCMGIGNVYKENEKYDLALEYLTKNLTITKATFGDSHVETGKSYMSLGKMFEDQRAFGRALDCFTRAFTIFQEKLGVSDSLTSLAKQRRSRCESVSVRSSVSSLASPPRPVVISSV